MSDPRWVSMRAVLALHEMLIDQFGGEHGVANLGLLESALARPMNLYLYENPSISKLAAAYAFGISQNHAFVDGNKRTAFVVMRVFLRKNAFDFVATEHQVVETFLALAAGALTEDQLANWVETYAIKSFTT